VPSLIAAFAAFNPVFAKPPKPLAIPPAAFIPAFATLATLAAPVTTPKKCAGVSI
jgi:hypothetical protein